MGEATPSGTATGAPTPFPSYTVIDAPGADGFQIAGALIAIVFCIVAAVLGYRILRGGRGL